MHCKMLVCMVTYEESQEEIPFFHKLDEMEWLVFSFHCSNIQDRLFIKHENHYMRI